METYKHIDGTDSKHSPGTGQAARSTAVDEAIERHYSESTQLVSALAEEKLTLEIHSPLAITGSLDDGTRK